jgi:hypothetical protein
LPALDSFLLGKRRIEMRVKELEPSVERAVAVNLWLRLALIFIAAPLLWLLLVYCLGQQIILGWLVVAAAYAVALLVGANSQPSVSNDSRRRLEISRSLVAWLSPLFWGGVLATPYLFLYLFLFDRGISSRGERLYREALSNKGMQRTRAAASLSWMLDWRSPLMPGVRYRLGSQAVFISGSNGFPLLNTP